VNYIKLSVKFSKRGEKFNMNNDFIELNDIDTLEVAKPLKDKMNLLLSNIKDKLLLIPSVIEVIRSYYPTKTLQAMLTKEQKADIANGLLEITTSKDGKNLLATLRDPKTKKIDAVIPLKEVELTPELNKAITNFALQFQLLQISAEIKSIQKVVEEVRKGQEYDRLAVAYSCQQKFLQAILIKNTTLKKEALLKIAFDAEDSRNLLMLSQKVNIDFIKNLPEGNLGKFFSIGTSVEKIDLRMNEIRESFFCINMVSLIQAFAYHQLEEYETEKQSLVYYGNFIKEKYLDVPNLLKRLDSIDPYVENYWTKKVPDIKKRIERHNELIEIELKKQNELEYKLNLLEAK
jgi:hypothetical protein